MKQSMLLYAALICCWMLFIIYYYNVFGLIKLIPRPAKHSVVRSYYASYKLTTTKPGERKTSTKFNPKEVKLLLNTSGCVIPEVKMDFKIAKYKTKPSCGQRAIDIVKIDTHRIKFLVNLNIMNFYAKSREYTCCYQYATRSTVSGREDTKLAYSMCINFENETETNLKYEVINIICNSKKTKEIIYEDSYAVVIKSRNLSPKLNSGEKKWNVLVIGMDTMSRLRFLATMPRMLDYMRRHNWLDFRGYQKVGFNTFPNLMSVLTGENVSTVYRKCAKGMTYCNDLLIWSKFREAGYATAYAEDDLKLPDTFSRHRGFRIPPTHHYLRPLFLTGESRQGPLTCTKKLPSVLHILNYAADFAETYVNDSIFGFFWLNSFSHNLNNNPTLIDEELVNFFTKLTLAGVMAKTIVMFVSDHGIRYGAMRVPVESYYEERLPMLFVWVPLDFRRSEEKGFANAEFNQFRLTTPYDLHMTMWDILKKSNSSLTVPLSGGCPRCVSLFSPITKERKCVDAGVSKKWCSCHTMEKGDEHDVGAKQSIDLAVKYVQNTIKSIKTKNCTKCNDLTLHTVPRVHFYADEGKTYYVIAFFMTPGNVGFEATVEKDTNNNYELQESVGTISAYSGHGTCVLNSNDMSYCVCIKTNCR